MQHQFKRLLFPNKYTQDRVHYINSPQSDSKQEWNDNNSKLNKQAMTDSTLRSCVTSEHQRLPEVSQWCSDDSQWTWSEHPESSESDASSLYRRWQRCSNDSTLYSNPSRLQFEHAQQYSHQHRFPCESRWVAGSEGLSPDGEQHDSESPASPTQP